MKGKSIVLALCLSGAAMFALGQSGDTVKIKDSYHEVNPYVNDNESCLQCHGEHVYTLTDTVFGRVSKEKVYDEIHIDRDNYYTGVHKSFACLDCHSMEFGEFPHPLETRYEEPFLCMDCHGYDETYAQYHFEDTEVQFQESIHNMEGFNCWSCHDPHSYRAFYRNSEDIAEAVVYDNNMCLGCHADYGNFMVLSDRDEINLIESHDWLPSQAAHFGSVRCIECHTEINDSVLIAHKILPKTQAVNDCAECHSRDSRLMHTLYKFQSKEERKAGLVNGVILNNTFVIGANQNPFLNTLSIIILLGTLGAIALHVLLRIRTKKSSKHGNA
ncbi:MAG: cytochrome c3 family protein [Bacteroidales bacterium]